MNSLAELKFEDFRRHLTLEYVRAMQLLHLAMPAGAVLFFGVNLVLGFQPPQEKPAFDDFMYNVLRLVLLLVSISVYGAAAVLPKFLLSEPQLARQAPPGPEPTVEATAAALLNLIRGALVTRLALLDGAALFGLVILLFSSLDGSLWREPLHWLSTLPAIILLLYTFICFPSRAYLERFFLHRVKRDFLDDPSYHPTR